MLKNFRTYQLAVQFHLECEKRLMDSYLKDQPLRASSSVALNLAEGSAKPTSKDQKKFYFIAMGSLRECQSILALKGVESSLSDQVGASLYKLIRAV